MLAKAPRPSALLAVLLLPQACGEPSEARSNDRERTSEPVTKRSPARLAYWLPSPSHKTKKRPVPASKQQKATHQNAQKPAKAYLGGWSSSEIKRVAVVVLICLAIALVCLLPILGWFSSGPSSDSTANTEVIPQSDLAAIPRGPSSDSTAYPEVIPQSDLEAIGRGVLVGNYVLTTVEEGVAFFHLAGGIFTPIDVFSEQWFIKTPNPRTARLLAAVAVTRMFEYDKSTIPPLDINGSESIKEWLSRLFMKTAESPKLNAQARKLFETLSVFGKSVVIEQTRRGRHALIFDHSGENLPHVFVLREVLT